MTVAVLRELWSLTDDLTVALQVTFLISANTWKIKMGFFICIFNFIGLQLKFKQFSLSYGISSVRHQQPNPPVSACPCYPFSASPGTFYCLNSGSPELDLQVSLMFPNLTFWRVQPHSIYNADYLSSLIKCLTSNKGFSFESWFKKKFTFSIIHPSQIH